MNNKYSHEDILGNIKKASEYYQEIIRHLMQNHSSSDILNGIISNEKNTEIAQKIYNQFVNNPEKFAKINLDYMNKLQKLIADSTSKFIGLNNKENKSSDQNKESNSEEKNGSSIDDKRFQDPAWHQNIFFDFIKKYYLLNSEWITENISKLELDDEHTNYAEFIARQFIDALSPSNFVFSNPEVIRAALDSGMSNIVNGLHNFLSDIKESGGLLNISTTDKSKFRVGKNIAITEGKVIYENSLAQLICYKPKKQTHQIPIFIIPPWINKYYILDLSEHNSLIKWLVDQNYQVYLVSWVNPGKELENKDFEDYLQEGVLGMINKLKGLGVEKVNALGYCIGGTLLTCALSYLKNKKDNFINSASFLTTLVDFSKPGDISAFLNDKTVENIEKEVTSKGYLDGKYISNGFGLIRANDLIWSFFVNNYLLGKTPAAFDILYWNSDSTNLPAKMYMFYLKNMYINNKLIDSDGIELLGEKINIREIDIDSFSLAAKRDHIALWDGVYEGYKLLGGNKTFCLTEAGHVAGVVNPAANRKYTHHISSGTEESPKNWLAKSKILEGSWWNSWQEWLKIRSGTLQNSLDYQTLEYIEKAPGRYIVNSPN